MIDPDAPSHWYDLIDSTNEEASRRARQGLFAPLWIEAGAQTAGRGRRGRSWTSEPGNVFMTYFGVAPTTPAQTALLGFAAAVAVGETINALAGRPIAQLKWPNDVLIERAKVCGILLESGPAGEGSTWFALGVGVNVISAPDGPNYPVASLAHAGVKIEAGALRDRLRAAITRLAACLEADGFAPIQARWTALAVGLSGDIRAQIGDEWIEGRAIGLGDDGCLMIETPQGRRRSISAGEVYFSG